MLYDDARADILCQEYGSPQEKFYIPIVFIGFLILMLIFWKFINGSSQMDEDHQGDQDENQNVNPEREMVDLRELQEELKKINQEHENIFSSEPNILCFKDDQKIIPRL